MQDSPQPAPVIPPAPIAPEAPTATAPQSPVVATQKSSNTVWIIVSFLVILIAAAAYYAYSQGLFGFGATTTEDSTAIEQELNTIDSEMQQLDTDLSQLEADSAGF